MDLMLVHPITGMMTWYTAKELKAKARAVATANGGKYSSHAVKVENGVATLVVQYSEWNSNWNASGTLVLEVLERPAESAAKAA